MRLEHNSPCVSQPMKEDHLQHKRNKTVVRALFFQNLLNIHTMTKETKEALALRYMFLLVIEHLG